MIGRWALVIIGAVMQIPPSGLPFSASGPRDATVEEGHGREILRVLACVALVGVVGVLFVADFESVNAGDHPALEFVAMLGGLLVDALAQFLQALSIR